MIAPNKVYILPSQHNLQYDNGGEEYIRKDALLEWIQEARATPHENAIVRDLAFQEIVNKINSM